MFIKFCIAAIVGLALFINPVLASPPSTLAKHQNWTISQGMSSHSVTDLLQDPHGFLWIATRNGLQRFDGIKFFHYKAAANEQSLPSNDVTDLWFEDQRLWVATSRGLAYFDYSQQRFYRFTPTSQLHSKVDQVVSNFDGSMLFITMGEVWQITNQQQSLVPLTYNSQPLGNIVNIHKGQQWLWLSEASGDIYVWDGRSHEVFKTTKENPITDPLPKVGFNHIMSRGETTWFAHDDGVFALDGNFRLQQQLPSEQAISRLAYVDQDHLLAGTDDYIRFIETPAQQPAYWTDEHSLPLQSGISSFSVDRLNRLWIGSSNNGLYCFYDSFEQVDLDLANNANNDVPASLRNLPLPISNYTNAVQDFYDYWWLTTDIGLVKYDAQNHQIIAIHTIPSATSISVQQMLLYAENLVLSATTNELFVFDINLEQWVTAPKLPSSFSHQPLTLVKKDNQLWVATTNEAVEINEFLTVVDRANLRSDNVDMPLNPLFVWVDTTKDSLSFDFVTPLAANPKNVRYRYRVTGLEPDWHYTQRPLQAIQYKRVPGGEYQLFVQASRDGKTWQLNYDQTINISGIWWQSPLAFSLYAILAVLILALSWRQYHRVIRSNAGLRERYYELNHSIDSGGTQLWDWRLASGELYRHNLWSHCQSFAIDGVRNGIADSITNVHEDDLERLKETLTAIKRGELTSFECGYRLDNDGQWLWVLDKGRVTESGPEGKPLRVQGVITDISTMINSEERMNMLALSLASISDGICIFDRFFRKREVNKAYETITGYEREQVLGQPFQLMTYDAEFVAQIKRAVFAEGSWRGELTDLRADGSEFQMEISMDAVIGDSGETELIVACFADVTERRNTENELRRLSNTDSLTGLPNRSYFQVSHSNLVRKKVPHALLTFDLDDFKKINDSLGHSIGDELLCRVAERLTDIGRRQDTLYRLGGDEFGLLVEDNTDINTISALANQINKTISEPYQVHEHEVVVGSSIGIVLYPHDGSTSQELLQKADTAMYHAKQRSGNCYQFFSQSMNENAILRLNTENQLRNAIRDDRIEVFYQPKIEPDSNHIAGIEALVRLRDTNGNLVSPSEFIPLAEETGLIVPLSEQVLRKSCRDMRQFLQYCGAPRSVAINLSARQFLSSSLAVHIENILAEEQLHPRHVEFEITEGMVMSDPERAIIMLENLADMGVQLALDDFGTGYSSLAYLKRFPIHTLKIDKAFVDDITTDEKDRNMVASIVAMAHNLGLKVVAEGVEEKEQLAILKALKCEYIQGFYFAKPMPAEALIRFIQDHQSVNCH